MRITDVRWVDNQGYAELALKLDGHEASIPLEQKPVLVAQDVFFVFAPDVEMPEIVLAATEDSGEQYLHYHIKSHAIAGLLRTMAEAITQGVFSPRDIAFEGES